jgi:hypothetical protein
LSRTAAPHTHFCGTGLIPAHISTATGRSPHPCHIVPGPVPSCVSRRGPRYAVHAACRPSCCVLRVACCPVHRACLLHAERYALDVVRCTSGMRHAPPCLLCGRFAVARGVPCMDRRTAVLRGCLASGDWGLCVSGALVVVTTTSGSPPLGWLTRRLPRQPACSPRLVRRQHKVQERRLSFTL